MRTAFDGLSGHDVARRSALHLDGQLFKVVGEALAPGAVARGSDVAPAAVPVRQFSQFLWLFQGCRLSALPTQYARVSDL